MPESRPSSLLQQNPEGFVHLHVHTQYSLLDGAIRLDDLFEKAREFNMPAVAMTDHGNMFGTIDFYLKAKKAGIKPIIGCEVYFTSGSRSDKNSRVSGKVVDSQNEEESDHQIYHLVLLCKNNTGYQNLCKLVSKAYLEGFYYKPRADYELLSRYSEGLIALTACLGGEANNLFLTDQDEKAYKAIGKLHKIFGDDLYLELQENAMQEQTKVNEKVIAASAKLGIPLIATNDCHYLNKEDSFAQEVLLCIQTGKTLSDDKRMRFPSDEFYFKSPQIMREQFSHVQEALDNTLRVAEMCNVDLTWKDEAGNQIYHLPEFEIPSGEGPEEYFAKVAREGLEKRFSGPHFKKLIEQENWETDTKPKYIERLEDEIKMCIKTGFAGYFLIVADFIKWSLDNGIPVGPGRGSGAGSLVAYSLYITNINPIPYNLLFERFINPERVSMPDFDIDFCQNGRGKVIDYVTRKYGKDRVGQIITFGTLSAKAVIKDVCRVFDIPYVEADIISKLIPDELGIKLDRAIELEPKLTEMIDSDSKIKQIFTIAKRLEGLFRHAGIHAAGLIITNRPMVEYCPLARGKEGESVCQFAKDDAEKVGLVKFDFLALKTLTAIDGAIKFIHRDYDPDFDIEAIDIEDKGVYDLLSSGETMGVFQLESSGMIDLCKRLRPGSLDDVTAVNALYRPGPLESGMVDDFIEARHGRKEVVYPFPELGPILKDTYGVIVYQEQVMNIARVIAGYTLGQADMLRKAMGKKIVSEMDRHREIFVEGAGERNFDIKKAAALYELMANFGAYGFNKSHALAYALIAYQTAYLKHYHPVPFFTSLLGTEMGNTDKISFYINDAKKWGIEVLPPDVNESLWLFNIASGNIRFGMGAVKNVGEVAVAELIQERDERGPFLGFVDFCERVNLKAFNKRVIESLIKVGAFDSCETMNRRTLLDNMEVVISYASKRQAEKALGQGGLFDQIGMFPDSNSNSDSGESEKSGINKILDIKESGELDELEKLSYESELIGIYVSGHPLDRFSDVMKQMASMEVAEVSLLEGADKRDLVLAGILTNQKPIITKKGDKMCKGFLEDLSGKIECVVFPSVYEDYNELLDSDEPLIMSGHVKLADSTRSFFPSKIQRLKKEAEEKVTAVRVNVSIEDLGLGKLQRFKQALLSYRGHVPIHIIFENSNSRGRLPLGPDFLVNPTPQMAAKINEIFEKNCVKFLINGHLENVTITSGDQT